MKSEINITEIMNILPHRYPFLLIDRVIEVVPNKSIIGIKNITCNEPQFTGHFPNKPVMPGVLIIEAMAQLSALLVAKSKADVDKNLQQDIYFMSIEQTKFRKIVEPGDVMYIYSEIKQQRGSAWKFKSNAKVGENIVAESEFAAMLK
jgi:3-hydroxyacyl-[acyl-carrier-protein] dehydratase